MNILVWLNKNIDAGDALFFCLIALDIWFIIWKLLYKVLGKYKLYDFMELGVLGSFGILIFLSIIIVLFVASIQAAIEYGVIMLFPLFIFWGTLTAFVIFFIKKFKDN